MTNFHRFAEILSEAAKFTPIKKKSGETIGYRKETEKTVGQAKDKSGAYKKAAVPKCDKCNKPMEFKDSGPSGDNYECKCGKRVRGWKTGYGWKALREAD